MNFLDIYLGFLIAVMVFCIVGFFYLLYHPRKKSGTKTVITYNLDTHKYGILYGFPDDDQWESDDAEYVDEEENDINETAGKDE